MKVRIIQIIIINKFKVDDCSSITYEENTNSKDLNLEMNLKIDKENINEKKLVTLQKFKSHHIKEDKFDLNLKQESNKKAYGFIAQEVEKAGYTDIVNTDKDTGDKTLDYNSAFAIAIAQMQARIKQLEDEIKELKNK